MGAEISNIFETEKSGPKIEKIGKVVPEGRPHAIFGGGALEEADPAEALELASQ